MTFDTFWVRVTVCTPPVDGGTLSVSFNSCIVSAMRLTCRGLVIPSPLRSSSRKVCRVATVLKPWRRKKGAYIGRPRDAKNSGMDETLLVCMVLRQVDARKSLDTCV